MTDIVPEGGEPANALEEVIDGVGLRLAKTVALEGEDVAEAEALVENAFRATQPGAAHAKAALHLAVTIVGSTTQPLKRCAEPAEKKPRGLQAAGMMAEALVWATAVQRAAERLKAEPAGQAAETMTEDEAEAARGAARTRRRSGRGRGRAHARRGGKGREGIAADVQVRTRATSNQRLVRRAVRRWAGRRRTLEAFLVASL